MIYTRKGDDGTTSLWYGGRVAKDDGRTDAYGTLDEANAALGVARSLTGDDAELAADILRIQDELFVAGAELATAPEAAERLEDGVSRITPEMASELEPLIDKYMDQVDLPPKFVLAGRDHAFRAPRSRAHDRPPGRAPRRDPRARRASSPPPICCASSTGRRTCSSQWRATPTSTTPSSSRAAARATERMRVVAKRRSGFAHDVEIEGGHSLVTDEPESAGGTDEGPSPTRLLAASLAACTAITVEMYADRKGWDVGALEADVETTLRRPRAQPGSTSPCARPRRSRTSRSKSS